MSTDATRAADRRSNGEHDYPAPAFGGFLAIWRHRATPKGLPLVCVFLIAVSELLAHTSLENGHEHYTKVLAIYSSRRDAPYTIAVENVLREAFVQGLEGRVDYYTEYIDFSRFSGPDYQSTIRDFLKRKYPTQRPDVIVSDGGASFEFLVKYRSEVFLDVPMVFSLERGEFRPIPNATGVLFPFDMKSTLNIALQLHPRAKRVLVIAGASQFDRYYERIARDQFRELADRIAIEYVTPMPMNGLEQFVTALPSDSIIYFASFFEDSTGLKLIPQEVLPRLSRAANAPMYCWPEMTLGLGIVGGDLLSEQEVARQTAAVALRVLRGERPDAIPTVEIKPYVRAFDGQQLQRWRISEERLPPGSVVLFKKESFWSVYRWRIIGTASLVAAQAFLIAGLLVQRRRRGRAERILIDKEAHLRASYERIQDLAGRLITAQEAERTRIARNLHDDACQEVAGVAVDISSLLNRRDALDPSVQQALSRAHTRVAGIAESLRLLSHELHPGVLQHVGLVAALEAHCVEVERIYNVQVWFVTDGDVEPTAPALALSLFRIAQEALSNAARHGHARRVTVTLARRDDAFTLSVADDGAGFDVADARQKGGLGLVSIEERARLAKGHVTIRSRPRQGTTVAVRVPLGGADDPQQQQGPPDSDGDPSAFADGAARPAPGTRA